MAETENDPAGNGRIPAPPAGDARLLTEIEARILRQPKSTPVLTVRKVDIDRNGTPFNYGESVWSSERVTFTVARD